MASSLEVPCDMQPGRLGHSATQYPSSPGYITASLILTEFIIGKLFA